MFGGGGKEVPDTLRLVTGDLGDVGERGGKGNDDMFPVYQYEGISSCLMTVAITWK